MYNKGKVKRVCSFNVSNWHFIAMIIPFVGRKIKEDTNIKTFFEEDKEEVVKAFLDRLVLKIEDKDKIEKLNWKMCSVELEKIAKKLEESVCEREEINLIISGRKEYIKSVNLNIDNWLSKNYSKIVYKNINIINCYEITQLNNNIEEILNVHDSILNTSGQKRLSEVFEGYIEKSDTKKNIG